MPVCKGWLHHGPPGSALRAIMQLSTFSLPPHTGQAYLLRRYPCFVATALSPAAPFRSGSALRSIVQLSTFSLPLCTGQAYLLRRYPCFAPATLSLHSRLRNALRSSAHTVSLRFSPGTLLCKRSFAALAHCRHFPLPCQSTFSQNFLSRAVAQVISNRLLL